MAVKGAVAKQEITEKILSTFEGAFINDKEIRVPVQENGERVEIKITLTAAKVNVGGNDGTAASIESEGTSTEASASPQVTEEEKTRIKTMADFLSNF